MSQHSDKLSPDPVPGSYSPPPDKASLLKKLVESQCLTFGDFKLKSGERSTFYLDLREISGIRDVWEEIVHNVCSIIDRRPKSSAPLAVVGVPYGVWPLASVVSWEKRLDFCPIRKETKGYGKQMDLGRYKDHEFIIIEDVISTGSSILETLEKMENLRITDIIIVADRRPDHLRGQGGLEDKYPEIRFHSVIDVNDLIQLSKNSL